MAVKRGDAALSELHARLFTNQAERLPYVQAPLPPRVETVGSTPLWSTGPTQLPLTDPAAYALPVPDHGLLDLPPALGLAHPDAETYCAHSVDLTMKGGTTSGVVYPLAVCEIARQRRIRNVGGASAGAIAASATAAAELGRMRTAAVAAGTATATTAAAGSAAPDTSGRAAPTGRSELGRRRFAPGFAGLAETVAWLTQLTPAGRERVAERPAVEEYRLAQLFRPARRTRALFRVIVCVMHKRWWALPLLAVRAFGRWSALLSALVVVGVPTAVTAMLPLTGAARITGWLGAAFAIWGLSVTTAAGWLVWTTFGKGLRAGGPGHPALAEPLPTPAPARPPRELLGPPVALAAGLLLLAAAFGLFGIGDQARTLLAAIGGWIVTVALVAVIAAAGASAVLRGARSAGFGLISGSTTIDQLSGRPLDWLERLADRVARIPSPTQERALVPWLSDTLSDLAGQPDVLRFGHLWLGPDYRPCPVGTELAKAQAAAAEPLLRQINLELMTTELVHGVPRRFPTDSNSLGGPSGRLYFRLSDLTGTAGSGAAVFPPEVIKAMLPPGSDDAQAPVGGSCHQPHCILDGRPVDDLHPLPDPWDLPVVVAVRMSLALPGLFQAIRLYEERPPLTVREDFGLPLRPATRIRRVADTDRLTFPASRPSGASPDTECACGGDRWVDELWFTDGGVTVNFPVHFFDRLLPAWPTLGINLGRHPRGFEWQDVWLPQDWQTQGPLPTPLDGGLVQFFNSILDTARGWNDTLQTVLPGFRSRIAQVRQRPDEGGSNLFMPASMIASLALRGQLAGARMRRRFAEDGHWRRHQWLRMRVTLAALSALRRRESGAVHTQPYAALLGDDPQGALERIMAAFAMDADNAPTTGSTAGAGIAAGIADPDAPPPSFWYAPTDGYWTAAAVVAGLLDEIQGDGAQSDGAQSDGAQGDGAQGDGAPGDGAPGDGARRRDFGGSERVLSDGAPQPAPYLRQAPIV